MQKLVHRTTIITALGIAIILAPAYAATITTYSDSGTFSAATQSLTTVDLDSYLSGQGDWKVNATSSGLTYGGVQFVGVNASGYTTYLFWGANDQTDWGTPADAIVETGYNTTHLHIVLPSGGVTAVGFNLISLYTNYVTYQAGVYPVTVAVNSTPLDQGPVTTASWNSSTSAKGSPSADGLSATYLGITSSVLITTLDLYVSGGSVAVENFSFGTAGTTTTTPDITSDAPEVSTMFLLGAGLLSIPLARRVRKGTA